MAGVALGLVVAGPVLLLAGLAALPPGRAAAGLWAVGAGLAIAWGLWAARLGPFAPSGGWEAVAALFLVAWTGALGLAALAQGLRPRLARRRGAYPAAVVALGLAGLLGFQMVA